MSKVTDLTDVRVCIVSDADEVTRLRRFQTQRYFETGLTTENPEQLPDDPSVAHSTYFGVYGGQDTIQACARLIHPTAGLPMLAHHELFASAHEGLLANAGHIAEVSRLAVAKNAPHHRALGLLAREFFRFGLRHQETTALLASIEVPFIRILDQVLGVPVEVIGPQIDQYQGFSGACVPVLIDTVRYLTEARWRDHRRWEFFTEGLIIDLTEPVASSAADDDWQRAAS